MFIRSLPPLCLLPRLSVQQTLVELQDTPSRVVLEPVGCEISAKLPLRGGPWGAFWDALSALPFKLWGFRLGQASDKEMAQTSTWQMTGFILAGLILCEPGLSAT